MDVGIILSMNTVGPTRKMNNASTKASTMLMFDNHWIPRATPETADSTKATVSTVMITTRMVLPTCPMPDTICRPLRICRAPRPSEAADPNSVAKIASMSMTLPAGPLARSPSSGSKAALTSCSRPLRYTP